MPPTKITSSISLTAVPASPMANLQGSIVFLTRSDTNCSSVDLCRVSTKCLGPEASAVINGKLISVCIKVESSIFALSADSLNL